MTPEMDEKSMAVGAAKTETGVGDFFSKFVLGALGAARAVGYDKNCPKVEAISKGYISPITYAGYDKNGQKVCSCTAIDVKTEYLNPDDVLREINDFLEVVYKEIMNISDALAFVEENVKGAMTIQGTDVIKPIEDTCAELQKLPTTFRDWIDDLYMEVVTQYTKLQTEENDKAYDTVNSRTDVNYTKQVSP